ncbi:MAG: hypothetical protein KAI06_09515 [Anaerolineales bacterium]|nr:hypothetical protein [Anaerolineales bacterium]
MSVIHQFQGQMLGLYARITHRTAPLKIEGWEYVTQAMATKRPILFTAWHGQTHLYIPVFLTHVDISGFSFIIVGDHRQKVLEPFTASMGAKALPVSMEDNSFAGARNVFGLINELRKGMYSLIAPDGPDGPARIAKRGTAFIATRAQAIILPFAAYSPYALHMPRWDRYSLPLPFAPIYWSARPPISASRDADHEMLLEEVTREINIANEQVEAMAKGRK